MIASLSLRARILTGAVFWTFGLVVLASAAVAASVEAHPHARDVVHSMLDGATPIVLSLGSMAIGLLLVGRALSGVDRIRLQLAALHAGHERRIHGVYPSEVQPLVNDLNVLLDQRDQAVERALGKAADLAHGLKTPLSILAQEADRLRACDHADVAVAIGQQVERMQRQVDYQLTHARAMTGRSAGARCMIRESVDGLVRALLRLHAERGLTIDVQVDANLTVSGHPADIEEMLGNLLDNACRFAVSRVAVHATAAAGRVAIVIDDDGPGLGAELRKQVLQRGVRADESGLGSGLGLAIVHDLTELYGGSITLEQSPTGGLRAVLVLPV